VSKSVSIGQRVTRRISRVSHFGSHRNFENYRDILFVLLQKELKVRYNNKGLGFLWSIANPLASALVYLIAFQILMRVRIPDYILILITGTFTWQWFTNVVGSSSNAFVGNAPLIKKVSFPRNIVLLCMSCNHLIHFLMSVPVILLFLVLHGHYPALTWIYGMPLLIAVQFTMAYGIALGLASINLFFRDMERLVGIILNFAFYLTPVLYPVETVPPKLRHLMLFNPAAPLIAAWRDLFINGKVDWLYLAVSAGYALLFYLLGTSIYKRLSWKFAEVI
jgi:lipopolysaccharide transport system permease protein